MSETNKRDPILDVCASNLVSYACAQKPNYTPAKYHYLIAKELMGCMTGKTKRLIIMCPPQHGKSELATQLFPAFYFGHFPENALIVGGYGQEKADDFGRATKEYMESEIYQAIFPNSRLSHTSNSISRFATTKGGTYFAAGRGGAVVGRGANGLILDDPYKNRAEADSESVCKSLEEWYTSSFRSRLRGDGFIIIIQQRWNKRDLIQFLLDKDKEDPNLDPDYKWRIIELKALIEDDDDARTDPLKRKVGESLWPEAFPPKVMLQMKKDVGTRDWNALYRQQPSDAQGEIYHRNWWNYWCESYCAADHDHHPLPKEFDDSMQMWDMSFKDLATSDYVVGLVGKRKGANLYVIDRNKAIANVKKSCDMIRYTSAKHQDVMKIGIEDKANGPAVITTLKDEIAGIIAIKAEGSKESRWQASAAAVESGNVYLPYSATWKEDFIEVCAAVPHGKHDDDADSIAHMILQMLGNRLAGMLEWMKEQVNKLRNKKAA